MKGLTGGGSIKKVAGLWKKGHRVRAYGEINTDNGKYMVVKHQRRKVSTLYTCSCPDFSFRLRECKHIKAFKRWERRAK